MKTIQVISVGMAFMAVLTQSVAQTHSTAHQTQAPTVSHAHSSSGHHAPLAPPHGTSQRHAHLHGPASSYLIANALKEGGTVIFMRHAKTRMHDTDKISSEQVVAGAGCELQRNLNSTGQTNSRELGVALKTLGIAIHEVKTSPYCRAVDTAKMAFAELGASIQVDEALAVPQSNRQVLGERLKQRFNTHPKGQDNILWVGHLFSPLTGFNLSLEEGEMLVAKPDNTGGHVLVGRITSTQWGDVMRDYLSYGDKIFTMISPTHASEKTHNH